MAAAMWLRVGEGGTSTPLARASSRWEEERRVLAWRIVLGAVERMEEGGRVERTGSKGETSASGPNMRAFRVCRVEEMGLERSASIDRFGIESEIKMEEKGWGCVDVPCSPKRAR